MNAVAHTREKFEGKHKPQISMRLNFLNRYVVPVHTLVFSVILFWYSLQDSSYLHPIVLPSSYCVSFVICDKYVYV